eukprot:UN06996
MERLMQEHEEHTFNEQGEIDQLILIDRMCDPISILATQRTYEGMIDELEGIDYSTADFQKELLGKAGQGKTRDGKKKITLNGSDRIFSECRDLNFEFALGPWFSRASIEVKNYFDQRHDAKKDMTKLKEFTQVLGIRSQDHMLLTLHINLSSDLGKRAHKFIPWKRKAKIEQDLLEGVQGTEDPEDYILELLARGKNMNNVLRLMCLTSLCRGGLRKFDQIRKEVLQSYGMHHLLTLLNMEKAGIIQSKKLLSFVKQDVKFNFSNLKKLLDLYFPLKPDNYLKGSNTLGLRDINTIGSNYAPMSVRLVERLHAL